MGISEKCRDGVEHGLLSRLILRAARAEPGLQQFMSPYVTARSNCPQTLVPRASVAVKQDDISSLLIKSRRPSIVRLSPRRSAQKWPEIKKDIP